jgi:hypothetical protein
MWNLQGENLGSLQVVNALPHCKEANTQNNDTSIASVHWNVCFYFNIDFIIAYR